MVVDGMVGVRFIVIPDLIRNLSHRQRLLDQPRLVGGAEDARDAFDIVKFLFLEFGVAARDDDERVGGQLMGPAHQVTGLFFRRFRDRAGVDDIDVGHGVPRDDLQAMGDESALVGGGFRIVQLAA